MLPASVIRWFDLWILLGMVVALLVEGKQGRGRGLFTIFGNMGFSGNGYMLEVQYRFHEIMCCFLVDTCFLKVSNFIELTLFKTTKS